MNPDCNSPAYWTPQTDVLITETRLVILVELAGMRKADLELSADGDRITIQGERGHPCLDDLHKSMHLVMEIQFGKFETNLELPKGYDLPNATASYPNGFLRIEVPEQNQAKAGMLARFRR